jgi:methylenetetrahydrofolate reductase (NADPH)
MEAARDPLAEGRDICVEMVQELADIPQIAGCHIMAPGNDAAVPDVIRASRMSIKRLAVA